MLIKLVEKTTLLENGGKILPYAADGSINWYSLSGIQFYPDIPFLGINPKEKSLIYSFSK